MIPGTEVKVVKIARLLKSHIRAKSAMNQYDGTIQTRILPVN
jgi:hypothetical protein